ncbi:hypothetical protein GCK72_004081 [Caenorhabditis remanei]|uniref:BTB domain-containing protein n=1 Tax=Caenorhabditis remanei TaxID=31234 RepID=A0A6A5HBG0_CAERE|nr:hypothetical protein GCK72_004081 [Caenorhabditis remanei]KAF1764134.1 hypothetical protein GCK72_004081 [Caenorhabditis remanei]
MTETPITYKLDTKKQAGASNSVLDISETSGLKCIWRCSMIDKLSSACLSWSFNWQELKKLKGINGLTGYILVTYYDNNTEQPPVRVEVDLTSEHQVIEKVIKKDTSFDDFKATFEFSLTPHKYPEELSYEEMFEASEKNDAVLVIGDKKLHVNKSFLSLHSDFFNALFSSNFKEGQMDEVPIKDIFFKDFGLLMSTIYPKNVFPNDPTAEKLLELADRFIMPSVTRQVENHLATVSQINNEKLMWMADKYGMKMLMEKTISQMDSAEKAKKLKMSNEYGELSNETKARLFERLVQIV